MKSQLIERTHTFSIRVIKVVNTLPSQRSFLVITDQLVRSSTSIGANIIEAQAASSRKDFINFFQIALKSANESKYWLGLLKDVLGSRNTEVESLEKEVTEIGKILGASIITMKKKT